MADHIAQNEQYEGRSARIYTTLVVEQAFLGYAEYNSFIHQNCKACYINWMESAGCKGK